MGSSRIPLHNDSAKKQVLHQEHVVSQQDLNGKITQDLVLDTKIHIFNDFILFLSDVLHVLIAGISTKHETSSLNGHSEIYSSCCRY